MIDFNGDELKLDKDDKDICRHTLGALQYLLRRYMKFQRAKIEGGFPLWIGGDVGTYSCTIDNYDKLIADDTEAITLMELLLADTEDK